MNLIAITEELYSNPIIQSSEFLKDICNSTISIYPEEGPNYPWIGYLAEEDGIIVGTCAYKSPPKSGEVEIAYFTFPEHEGRGLATSMAQKLIELASENGSFRIKAQTLPQKNASTHILEKLGFTFIGELNNPEDGQVWEWHK